MKKLNSLTKIFFLFFLFVIFGASSVGAQSLPACGQGQANGLTDGDIDHYDLSCFFQIPDSYISLAASRKFLWIDRSVGVNIHNSLNCLAAGVPYSEALSSCRRDMTVDEYVSNSKYNRDNWDCIHYGDGSWYGNVSNFINNVGLSRCSDRSAVTPSYSSYNVINFQFSYLSVNPDSDILSTTGGFFVNTASVRDVFDMRNFEAGYPNTRFVYATTSLSKGIGGSVSFNFNNQMRSYTLQNGLPLLDFADIGSHEKDGSACLESGTSNPILCDTYTDEVNGGHLNAQGGQRMSKAVWLMMSSLSGWNPGGSNQTPTPTRTPTATPTRTPTPTTTPSPTPVPVSADANGDGKVDGVDYMIWLNHYNQTTSNGRLDGDFNNSGRVDGSDYVIWTTQYSV